MTHRILLVPAAVLPFLAAAVHAHHSWSVDYDTRRTIVVEGVVSEYLGRRPHAAMTIEVSTPEDRAGQWTVEWGGSFRDSSGQQYGPDLFEPGEAITITGQPHRDETSNFVRLRSVVREADGTRFESSRGNRGGRSRR